MTEETGDLTESIAYCGLICRLCFLADKCDGCKTQNNNCERNCSDQGCFQKQCCEARNYTGCWECADIYNCEKGIYSNGNHKVKAFATAIREDGKERFIANVLRNINEGRSVEKGKDFDGRSVAEVLAMLRE